MNILSAVLLSIAINMDTLKISFSSKSDNSTLFKFKILFIAIFTSIITFLSMFLGKIIDIYLTQKLSNIFGSVLLGFVGIYYIVEHIRKEKDKDGYDTSHYVENFIKHKNIIEFENTSDNSHLITNLINLSFALSINNIWPCIAGSLTGIDISLTLLLNFLICITFYIVGILIQKKSLIRYIRLNHYLITAGLLIFLSLVEGFI